MKFRKLTNRGYPIGNFLLCLQRRATAKSDQDQRDCQSQPVRQPDRSRACSLSNFPRVARLTHGHLRLNQVHEWSQWLDTVALGFQKQQPWNQKIAALASRPGLSIGERRLTSGVVSQCETKRSETKNSGERGTVVKARFVIAMHAGDHVPPGSSGRSAAMRLAGHDHSSPVLLAPVGCSRIRHAAGEVAAARAAGEAGTAFILCSISGRAMEDVRDASLSSVWCQLYLIGGALRRRLRLLEPHQPDSPHSS